MPRLISIAGLAVMVIGFAGLVTGHEFFSPSPLVIAVQVAGVVLMLWARITFGRRSLHAAADPTEGGLVTTGPYRFIRHPIYTAACLICWAAVLGHASVRTVLLGSLVLVGGLMRMLSEERLLVERYPEYRQYALVTKRMVPYVF
jgi:protein-S-isoprenylcysteine O-methyltransferase Ste14